MAELLLAETASVSTPSAGVVSVYVDTTANPLLCLKNDAGNVWSVSGVSNYSVTSQNITTTTRAYITGSNIAVPVNKLQVGTQLEWVMNYTKTGAGTALSTFDICFGTAGTTTDTARVSFTKPAGTAVADEGTVTIRATIRTIGATGVCVGQFYLTHNLAATGHSVLPCVNVNTVSAGFDMTVANLIVGICLTAGASDNVTFQLVQAKAWNI